MIQKIYRVNVYTDKLFSGHPVAVCPFNEWLTNDLLQSIAIENGAPESAFYIRQGNEYQIRLFTLKGEVNFSVYGTLAVAYVLVNLECHNDNVVDFRFQEVGKISVIKQNELFTLSFPKKVFEKLKFQSDFNGCSDILPLLQVDGRSDYVMIFENESQLNDLTAYLPQTSITDGRGLIVTANRVEFVSDFIASQLSIEKDIGSAYSNLLPFWANELGQSESGAAQLSRRKGYLKCRVFSNKIEITAEVKLFMRGEVFTS